jgi:hypothetical protein
MALVDDLQLLEKKLSELITRYDQYFIGFEKREPLPLLDEVQKLVKRYANTPINNTMYKHKYTMLVARFNTYREYWHRILKMIEEGRYSRDKFISDLHQRQRGIVQKPSSDKMPESRPQSDLELDRLLLELRNARQECNLPTETITRELIAATIEKQKPLLAEKLGTENISFRVVVEDGKPKLKAGIRK